ncbi:hypothetical protein EPA3_144 [Pseudomonas phage vB_PaM_EPA3]|nr:hypothetical protein EPA3_144 [Pseudomonas phage vB_PaM_EPA3]
MDNLSVKIVLSELSYKALTQAFALLGRVSKIQGDMAKVGGAWRGIEFYVLISEINA